MPIYWDNTWFWGPIEFACTLNIQYTNIQLNISNPNFDNPKTVVILYFISNEFQCQKLILYYQKIHESWQVCKLQSPCTLPSSLGTNFYWGTFSSSFLFIDVRTRGRKNVFREVSHSPTKPWHHCQTSAWYSNNPWHKPKAWYCVPNKMFLPEEYPSPNQYPYSSPLQPFNPSHHYFFLLSSPHNNLESGLVSDHSPIIIPPKKTSLSNYRKTHDSYKRAKWRFFTNNKTSNH